MTGGRVPRTVFESCRPRADVLSGLVEADFAADLARVVRGEAGAEYADPARFFANTYPTKAYSEENQFIADQVAEIGNLVTRSDERCPR